MTPELWTDLLIILGLAFAWMGCMILRVNGLPRQLRRGDVPTALAGTPEAFGLWWLDQYSYIGIGVMTVGGLCLISSALI